MNTDNRKIVDQPLDKWIKKEEYQEYFPTFGTTDYPTCYQMMAEYMNKHIHPNVSKRAIIQQIKTEETIPFDEIIYLNDHGADHVKMVINRASELLVKSEAKLTPYEAYILLVAIHFHDVGIWLGRNGHEKKINEIMQKEGVKSHLPQDNLVLKAIKSIAQAHGGHICDDKDTIPQVKKNFKLNHQEVRKRFLAAVLRIADEFADDRNRAERFVVEDNNGNQDIPEHSKIYHEYSYSLHTVDINKRDINLLFHIPKNKATRKFSKEVKTKNGKKVVKVYLLDEIYDRALKMHRENIYCKPYLISGDIIIEKIRGTIHIFDDNYNNCLEEIPYELKEKGYPDLKGNIFNFCPDLHNKNGTWLAKKLKSGNNSLCQTA